MFLSSWDVKVKFYKAENTANILKFHKHICLYVTALSELMLHNTQSICHTFNTVSSSHSQSFYLFSNQIQQVKGWLASHIWHLEGNKRCTEKVQKFKFSRAWNSVSCCLLSHTVLCMDTTSGSLTSTAWYILIQLHNLISQKTLSVICYHFNTADQERNWDQLKAHTFISILVFWSFSQNDAWQLLQKRKLRFS